MILYMYVKFYIFIYYTYKMFSNIISEYTQTHTFSLQCKNAMEESGGFYLPKGMTRRLIFRHWSRGKVGEGKISK